MCVCVRVRACVRMLMFIPLANIYKVLAVCQALLSHWESEARAQMGREGCLPDGHGPSSLPLASPPHGFLVGGGGFLLWVLSFPVAGCRVRIPAEVLILNSIVLPHKELSRSFTNQIIL